MSGDVYQQLCVPDSGPSILYSLPKIYKPDICNKFQFRPMFAAYNTARFKLANFLDPIDAPVTSSKNTVENSSSFVEDYTKQTKPRNLFAQGLV